MRVHLRFTEKDRDLCRWRRSVKPNMLSYYITQILLSEIREEVAYLPTAIKASADASPCDANLILKEDAVEAYISAIPRYKRNGTIKRIIRKHLQAQHLASEMVVVQSDNSGKLPAQSAPAIPPVPKPAPKPKEKKAEVPKNDYVESEEDRAAILALIAMGGE